MLAILYQARYGVKGLDKESVTSSELTEVIFFLNIILPEALKH